MEPMNEGQTGAAGAATPEREAPHMGPLARYMNVFFSPAAVYEDVRRNPGGFWVPIVICAIVTAIFACFYVGKYDVALVVKEQLKDSATMKIVAGLQGPAAKDKAIEMAVKQIAATPVWQMQISQGAQTLAGYTMVVWFFTFLYSLIALMMGWLPEARASKLFINLGIVAATGVVFIVLSSVLQFSRVAAAKGRGAGEIAASAPAWIAIAGLAVALVATGLVLWSTSRLAREISFGRILGAVSYSIAPLAISSLVGLGLVFLRTPDATPFDEMVPSNLTTLLNLKESGGALASLGSSLELFSLWSIVLAIIGISKVLARKTGQAAALVLIPWAVWVLTKTGFAALFG